MFAIRTLVYLIFIFDLGWEQICLWCFQVGTFHPGHFIKLSPTTTPPEVLTVSNDVSEPSCLHKLRWNHFLWFFDMFFTLAPILDPSLATATGYLFLLYLTPLLWSGTINCRRSRFPSFLVIDIATNPWYPQDIPYSASLFCLGC